MAAMGFHSCGSIDEARRQATAALAAQRALLAQDRRPLVVRNAARAQQYLGAIRALQGELAAAEHDFDEAHESIARLARLDPENISLQWDAVNLDFEKGRLLILSGRYAEAPARLQPALALYAKQPEDDSGPGLGLLHAWLGEMHFALRNYPEALRAYQKSADVIGKDAQYDDARCGVAADYARIGDALLRLNRLEEAGRAYARALAAANEPFSLAHGDVPALYPIAAAQAGIGDLAMALAHRSPGRTERVRHLAEACASYQQSIDTWRRIGQPALFSPSQFPAAGPRGLGDRLATCRAAVQRGAE